MSEENSRFKQFCDLLTDDGPVAITIKQSLAPANDDDPVIFPPSYPLTTFKGRVRTVRDGDYRVSVELPPDPKGDKAEKSSDQTPGYNIDRFPDGTNSCEIDSPQSQANRIEPTFKTRYSSLVPQIEISVGTNGTKVNLLEAGHRAADAVVRFSSLADKFHSAFLDAKAGNYFSLATLAPTSLVFGVWDSRSTRVKIQRIVKAQIRASNVYEMTRSALFRPAADYVAVGAVDEERNSGKGDENALSEQGMLHALATQTVGGVMLVLLPRKSEVTRTVALNLSAVRQLRAGEVKERTRALQRYILGLALIATTAEPDLSLREGCNLRVKDSKDEIRCVPRRGDPEPVKFDRADIPEFAEWAARQFFVLAGIDFDDKNQLNVVFEKGVADDFLGRKKEEREKISRLGPITADRLKRFDEQKNDTFKPLRDRIKAVKEALGKAPKEKAPRIRNIEAFKPLLEALQSISQSTSLPADTISLARELATLAGEHSDSHETLKNIESKLKGFKKAPKSAGEQPNPDTARGVS